MPLHKGKKNIGKNMATEVHGKPKKQAIDMAMHVEEFHKKFHKKMKQMKH